MERALLLCRPLQRYLNQCFKNESLVSGYKALVVATSPCHSLAAHVDLEAARAAAFDSNLQIISGRGGVLVLEQYANMLLNFDDPGWSHTTLSIMEKCASLCFPRNRARHFIFLGKISGR